MKITLKYNERIILKIGGVGSKMGC